MSRTRSPGLLALAALSLTGLTPRPADAQQGTWALTNARIQTVTHGLIERGTIVIKDGLIAAVGPAVAVPADARVLDLSGLTVSPGIIDLASTLGAAGTEPPPRAGRFGAGAQDSSDGHPVGLDPARLMADELQIGDADLEAARGAGITAVLVAGNRGAFRGRSALVPTAPGLEATSILRSPVAVQLGFQGIQGSYPATLLGVIAYQRQSFYDAQRYGLIADRYRSNPRGLARPAYDPGLEALVPAVRGALPVFVAAANENELRRAARIADEFKLRLTVVGATEGWRALDALAGRTAVVSVNFPKSPDVTGWAYRLSSRFAADSATADQAGRAVIEGNAAALHRAGVTIALGSGGLRPTEFLGNVRKAIGAGLPADAALAALTIEPARLAGMGDALGSVEAGKIANLVLTEGGDLLADSARIKAVFVDGARYEVAPPPAPRNGQSAGGAPAAVGGTWSMTLTSPQGPMDITMTITQTGASFTGSMTSLMGTTPIDAGRIDGRAVSWTMSVNMGGQSMDIAFDGEVDGTRMTGSAALGSLGSASFTAEKKP
jgi:imidazolonepropionase-like amidohydrolase